MSKYVRFVYAASSTAVPANIREHLTDIEKIGSNLNAMLAMQGVLIYGNGFFLHYIEGLQEQIDKIHDVSMQSTYTKDFKLLKREPIEKVHFHSWTIKYFIKEEPLKQFFHKHALGRFNPYKLSGDVLDELLYLLRQQDEVVHKSFIEQYEHLMHEVNQPGTGNKVPFNYLFLGILATIVVILVSLMAWHFNVMGIHH